MTGNVVVLTGGVGGAKLVLGLTQILPPERITAIVNTGDDFTHLGLRISPDIDTLLYTLSGQSNQVQGWGREGESWSFMAALQSLGGEGWFNLGDGDLALHVLRTARLAQGQTLTGITSDFTTAWNIGATVLPMSDQPVATLLATDEGELSFQQYFVARRCEPAVRSLRFEGASAALPAPGVEEAIAQAEVVVIAPSNPYLSIDPILAVPGIREALAASRAPVVAISPIVGGRAVKGPTADLMRNFGLEVSPVTVAEHYDGLLSGMIVDLRDGADSLELPHLVCDTLMTTLDDRIRVAEASLELARSLQ